MDWAVCLLFNKTHDKVLLQKNQRDKWIAVKAHVPKGTRPDEAADKRIAALAGGEHTMLPIIATNLISIYTTFHTYAAAIDEMEPDQHYLKWFPVSDILTEGVESDWLDGDGSVQYGVAMALKRFAGDTE